MARVSADTLRTTSNAKPDAEPAKRGRRATNGNPAQAARRSAPPAEVEDAEIVDETAEAPVDEATPAASSKQLELDAEADTEETPAPTPAPRRGVTPRTTIPAGAARAALPMAQQADADQAEYHEQVSAADMRQIQDDLLGEDRDLLSLGKLTRFALENGLTVEDCVERFRAMVSAYDRTKGA